MTSIGSASSATPGPGTFEFDTSAAGSSNKGHNYIPTA